MPFDGDGAVELTKDFIEPGSATQNRVIAGNDMCIGLFAPWNQLRREIASTDVLGQCLANDFLDIGGKHGVEIRLLRQLFQSQRVAALGKLEVFQKTHAKQHLIATHVRVNIGLNVVQRNVSHANARQAS